MKQPAGHHPVDDGCYEDDCYPECAEDGQRWPCKTWRRWTKSKDYRIAELEALTKRLAGESARHGERLRELEQTARDDSNILRNGIFHAVSDMGKHGRMGSLALSWAADEQDVTLAGSSHAIRVAGPRELTVTYAGVDDRTWTNGAVTERVHRRDG